MVRTQIQLTETQYHRLKRWAQDRHISLSEAIRRCVDECLAAGETAPTRTAMVREALAVAGSYRDPEGLTTVAREHDDHLADAFRR